MYKLRLPGLHFKVKNDNTMNSTHFVIFHPQNQILGLILSAEGLQLLEKIINFRAILEVLWLSDNDLS